MNINKILSNEIGVDSGQVIVIDYEVALKEYVNNEFLSTERFKDTQTDEVILRPSNFEEIYKDDKTYNQCISEKLLVSLGYIKTGELDYNGVCLETISKEGYGNIGTKAVAVSSGYGDGCYSAEIIGEKIVIDFVGDEENEDEEEENYYSREDNYENTLEVECKSGKLLIIDPCYIPDSIDFSALIDTDKGVYEVAIYSNEDSRISRIEICLKEKYINI